MPGPISRWILSRVVRSGQAFEAEAISAYTRLLAKVRASGGACDETLENSLCHLLEEEETHKKVLDDASTGAYSAEELERILGGHLYAGLEQIRPLDPATLALWGPDLRAALEQEEKTWVFYGNLRRMSKIPAVKRAFEVLASMEKEHVDILRKLLGEG
jgi:rubrerythrin